MMDNRLVSISWSTEYTVFHMLNPALRCDACERTVSAIYRMNTPWCKDDLCGACYKILRDYPGWFALIGLAREADRLCP